MNYKALLALVNSVAIEIAEGKSADELDLLSAVFVLLSDALGLISTVKGQDSANDTNSGDTSNQAGSDKNTDDSSKKDN